MVELVVTEPFACSDNGALRRFAKGDVIADPAWVERVLAEFPQHVVRRAAPPPAHQE